MGEWGKNTIPGSVLKLMEIYEERLRKKKVGRFPVPTRTEAKFKILGVGDRLRTIHSWDHE